MANSEKKLFEFEERNNSFVKKSEMHPGRSNHVFVEVMLTGELVAIVSWDWEQSMNQTKSFTISNNSWRHLPKLVNERHSLSACTLSNSFIYQLYCYVVHLFDRWFIGYKLRVVFEHDRAVELCVVTKLQRGDALEECILVGAVQRSEAVAVGLVRYQQEPDHDIRGLVGNGPSRA
jgi:hypothetical protein